MTNMFIQQIVTLLLFCLKTYTSSKVSIMNRTMVLTWIPPLALLLTTYLRKSLKSKPPTLPHIPPPVAKVYQWYLCHPRGKTQSTITPTHQLTWPTYKIHHRGTNQRGSSTFVGYFGFPRFQQHSCHHCLQIADTHLPKSTLGQ